MVSAKAAFEIVTPRLVIRPMTEGDVDAYARIQTDAGAKFAPDEMVEKLRDERAAKQRRHTLWLLGVLKDNPDVAVLEMSFYRRRQFRKDVSVGYYTLSGFRKQGYMSEALAHTLKPMKAMLNVTQVKAEVDADNEASIKTLQRAGFMSRWGLPDESNLLHFRHGR